MTFIAVVLFWTTASFVQAQESRAAADVKVGAATKGCMVNISRPSTMARWRAFQNGALWKSRKGPWGPQRSFFCGGIGITEATRTGADYILFDVSTGPSICMPAVGSCP